MEQETISCMELFILFPHIFIECRNREKNFVLNYFQIYKKAGDNNLLYVYKLKIYTSMFYITFDWTKKKKENDEKSSFYLDYQNMNYLFSRPQSFNILRPSSVLLTDYPRKPSRSVNVNKRQAAKGSKTLPALRNQR